MFGIMYTQTGRIVTIDEDQMQEVVNELLLSGVDTTQFTVTNFGNVGFTLTPQDDELAVYLKLKYS